MEQDERELRAARNQSMFRAVNERIRELNDGLPAATDEHLIACECADVNCVQTLFVGEAEYEGVRGNPRHFAVLPGHIYPDVETIVREADNYVVVEKIAKAAEVAEQLAEQG